MCSEYTGGAAICTVGEDKTLGRPVIQYRETDWQFLMRMASHCGGVLVPETHRGLPQLCDLGWYTIFKGEPFLIAEKYAKLERGELLFTYRLGRPGLGWGKMLYNEKISGMTLLGEVLETSRETLKLKLDIDEGWDPGGPYPYTWRPETGNFMYCMPQVGTRVSLYCPNYDEKAAIAVNCVRTNGADCGRMSDPAKRSFVTEHGKEMNLYPQEMSLVGSTTDNIWGNILVSDDEGITINSPKPIVVTAKEDIVMESSAVNAQVVNGEIVAAKGDPVTGSVDSSFVMYSNYDAVAESITGAEGRNCVAYEPYDDAPEEAGFDWAGLIGNVLAGLAVVAAVAVILFTAGAAAPIVIGAVAVGSAAVIGKGVLDYKSGEVSSVVSYMLAGLAGAFTGAAMVYTVYSWSAIWPEIKAALSIVKDFFSTPIPLPLFPSPELALQTLNGITVASSMPATITIGEVINAVVTGVAVGEVLWTYLMAMSKNGTGLQQQKPTTGNGSSNTYSYKNGKYEGANYHSKQTTGKKSPAPKDGQFALDNSVSIGDSTTRRVGLDINGDFVVLDETSPGIFHGHIREWNGSSTLQELSQEMKNALYRAGYITSSAGSKGKLTQYAWDILIGGF